MGDRTQRAVLLLFILLVAALSYHTLYTRYETRVLTGDEPQYIKDLTIVAQDLHIRVPSAETALPSEVFQGNRLIRGYGMSVFLLLPFKFLQVPGCIVLWAFVFAGSLLFLAASLRYFFSFSETLVVMLLVGFCSPLFVMSSWLMSENLAAFVICAMTYFALRWHHTAKASIRSWWLALFAALALQAVYVRYLPLTLAFIILLFLAAWRRGFLLSPRVVALMILLCAPFAACHYFFYLARTAAPAGTPITFRQIWDQSSLHNFFRLFSAMFWDMQHGVLPYFPVFAFAFCAGLVRKARPAVLVALAFIGPYLLALSVISTVGEQPPARLWSVTTPVFAFFVGIVYKEFHQRRPFRILFWILTGWTALTTICYLYNPDVLLNNLGNSKLFELYHRLTGVDVAALFPAIYQNGDYLFFWLSFAALVLFCFAACLKSYRFGAGGLLATALWWGWGAAGAHPMDLRMVRLADAANSPVIDTHDTETFSEPVHRDGPVEPLGCLCEVRRSPVGGPEVYAGPPSPNTSPMGMILSADRVIASLPNVESWNLDRIDCRFFYRDRFGRKRTLYGLYSGMKQVLMSQGAVHAGGPVNATGQLEPETYLDVRIFAPVPMWLSQAAITDGAGAQLVATNLRRSTSADNARSSDNGVPFDGDHLLTFSASDQKLVRIPLSGRSLDLSKGVSYRLGTSLGTVSGRVPPLGCPALENNGTTGKTAAAFTISSLLGNSQPATLVDTTCQGRLLRQQEHSGTIIGDPGTIALTIPFTVQFVVKPAARQASYAHILGNHPGRGNDGFVVQQNGDQLNRYYFAFGDGASFGQPLNIDLKPDTWQYVQIVVQPDRCVVYIDGEIANQASIQGRRFSDSPLPLKVGNWIHEDRPFNGGVAAIRIDNAIVPPRKYSGAEWLSIRQLLDGATGSRF